ncbi:MAG: helix-turn-helix domain-containing protein [Arcobacter sp.]|nr:helix-turn-helix domain-containing protein [Arcobacter sp.]
MVTKLTVKEYAELLEISTVAVYKKISNQTINSIKENNKTLVIVEDKELTNFSKITNKQKNNLQINSLESYLKVENKQLKKQVKKLQKELKKSQDTKESLLMNYVSEMKNLYLPPGQKVEKKKKSKKGGKTK